MINISLIFTQFYKQLLFFYFYMYMIKSKLTLYNQNLTVCLFLNSYWKSSHQVVEITLCCHYCQLFGYQLILLSKWMWQVLRIYRNKNSIQLRATNVCLKIVKPFMYNIMNVRYLQQDVSDSRMRNICVSNLDRCHRLTHSQRHL